MSTGSYEVGWRLREAAPDDAADLYWQVATLESVAANDDLSLLGRDPMDYYEGAYLRATPEAFPPNRAVPKPTPSLEVTRNRGYEHRYTKMRDEQIVCVGAGAGSLVLAAYLVRRGADPANISFVDPRGEFGGIWTENWARTAGFNNPKALTFTPSCGLDLADRRGEWMHQYLLDIGDHHLTQASLYPDVVTSMERGRHGDRTWVVGTAEGRQLEANSVILATGRERPKKLDGHYIRSNLDEVAATIPDEQLLVEHHQRMLTDEELSSGRPIVLIGLGNSTAAMLDQIQKYEDSPGHSGVPYYVLTHLPEEAVYDPEHNFAGRLSIFRKPAEGYLTGYSGDLPRDRRSYFRALYEGRVATDVKAINYNNGSGQLEVAMEQGFIDVRDPHVFSLIGYDRDLSLFRGMGALSRGVLHRSKVEPDIRPCDGAVQTHRDGFMSNVYASGSVMADGDHPNAAVLPGIQAQAPGTSLTIAMRNLARRR